MPSMLCSLLTDTVQHMERTHVYTHAKLMFSHVRQRYIRNASPAVIAMVQFMKLQLV